MQSGSFSLSSLAPPLNVAISELIHKQSTRPASGDARNAASVEEGALLRHQAAQASVQPTTETAASDFGSGFNATA